MKPKWYLLLEEQRYGKGITMDGAAAGGRLGLTVSFLLGALRSTHQARPNRQSIVGELRRLLASMMGEHSPGSVIRIYECDTLRQPTACLSDQSSASLGDAVILADESHSKLFAWPQYFSDGSRHLESLVQGLFVLLESPLREERFSYRHGKYESFDADDVAFVKRAFARDDDS